MHVHVLQAVTNWDSANYEKGWTGMSKAIETTKAGIGFGSALAMVISYAHWHDVGWAILDGILGWIYVVYHLLRY
jgi:hypothetical protein